MVIGVLIALGAGQLAEAWNWQGKVEMAEAQLHRESGPNFAYAAEHVTTAPCIDAKLTALRARLLKSADRLDPAPMYGEAMSRYVCPSPMRPYALTVWEAVNQDGTAARMDARVHDAYAGAYGQLESLYQMAGASEKTLGRLVVLGAPIPLDAGTRASLLGDIEEQRNRTGLQAVVSVQVMSVLRDLGVAPPGDTVDEFLATNSRTVQFCKEHGLPVRSWRDALAEVPSLPVSAAAPE